MEGINNQIYQMELEENCRKNSLNYDAFRDCNILITGAGGLIGSYLIDTFIKMNDTLGLKVHMTALCHSGNKGKKRFADYLDRLDFELLSGDAGKGEIYKRSKYYGNWDYMVHGAGNAHPQAFAQQPVETMKANLLGILHLLEAAVRQEVRHPVQKIVMLSSGEIYGRSVLESEDGWHETEAGMVDSMDIRSCYPEGKRAAETLCVSYAAEYGIKSVVARLSYIYGVTMSADNTRADVQFLSRAASGEAVVMKSPGEQYRSYCYLQDAVIGLLIIMCKGEAGEAYNIANRYSNTTIRKFAETVSDVFRVPLCFERASEKEKVGYSRMQQEILNAEKLMALGWKPEVDLRNGIGRIRKMLQE